MQNHTPYSNNKKTKYPPYPTLLQQHLHSLNIKNQIRKNQKHFTYLGTTSLHQVCIKNLHTKQVTLTTHTITTTQNTLSEQNTIPIQITPHIQNT